MVKPGVPLYSLYGEFGDIAVDRFIHVETIIARSGPNDWMIRPHAHATLGHLLFVNSGGGDMLIEGERKVFGRAVLTVPVGTVHGFRFDPGTEGHVATVADPLLRRLAGRHPAILALHDSARILPFPTAATFADLLDVLAAEAATGTSLADLAAEALLQLLLIRACRLLPAAGSAAPPRRAAALVAAYRAAIDRHLRNGWTVADHSRALGISPSRLRACCIEVARTAPIDMLHQRLVAEARRQLIYTDRGAAEIGYELGFEDPAYFSRFFRRATGAPPAAWRAAQIAANRG